MQLTDSQFVCQGKVIGSANAKLRKTSVAVIGVGGTGCNAALLLAQLCVKQVTLIDPDVVETSNLGRQPLFAESDVGKFKAETAVQKLKPHKNTSFLAIVDLLTEKNAAKLIGSVDVVLDCTDNYASRKAINSFCLHKKIPWVYCGAIRDQIMVSTIIPGKTPCFNCFASKPLCEVSCCEEGIIPTATSIAASIQVQEFVNLLAGKPKLASKMLHMNLSTLTFSIFPLEKKCKNCKNYVK